MAFTFAFQINLNLHDLRKYYSKSVIFQFVDTQFINVDLSLMNMELKSTKAVKGIFHLTIVHDINIIGNNI